MCNILELPVKWDVTSEEDVHEAEILGKEVEEILEDGILYTVKDKITTFNEVASEGTTTIRTADGRAWEIYMSINDFIKLYNE